MSTWAARCPWIKKYPPRKHLQGRFPPHIISTLSGAPTTWKPFETPSSRHNKTGRVDAVFARRLDDKFLSLFTPHWLSGCLAVWFKAGGHTVGGTQHLFTK
jgi:hypothetical protein